MRGVGDWTELQYMDPHSIGHNRVFSCSPVLLNRGLRGPLLGAGFLYRILSPTGLVSKLIWLPVFTKLYNSSTPPSCGRHNCTHSAHPRQGYNSDIPRPDAPVIYIGAFPILTAQLGHRSIYNTHTHTYIYVCVCTYIYIYIYIYIHT